jgi:hypothetical protein
MNMADDRRLELLDLDARRPPALRCQRLDAPAGPDAGEILEADPADRLDAGNLVTSYRWSWCPGGGLRDCRPPAIAERAGSAACAVLGFARLAGSFFWDGTVALVAVDLANVAERNHVKIEQELLSQAVRRLAEVSAQLDAGGDGLAGPGAAESVAGGRAEAS